MCFFFNDTATTEIYTLSLHDALPISSTERPVTPRTRRSSPCTANIPGTTRKQVMTVVELMNLEEQVDLDFTVARRRARLRSEEHTSELQSRQYLVCRLLLEKKKI